MDPSSIGPAHLDLGQVAMDIFFLFFSSLSPVTHFTKVGPTEYKLPLHTPPRLPALRCLREAADPRKEVGTRTGNFVPGVGMMSRTRAFLETTK